MLHRLAIFAVAAAFLPATGCSEAGESSAVLDRYIQVSTALANDDIAAAKKAATALLEIARAEKLEAFAAEAAKLPAAKSIGEARRAFKTVSAEAEKLAAGKKAYHVMMCPMVNADWVQKKTAIENPYMGQAMLDCGMEKP